MLVIIISDLKQSLTYWNQIRFVICCFIYLFKLVAVTISNVIKYGYRAHILMNYISNINFDSIKHYKISRSRMCEETSGNFTVKLRFLNW